MSTNLHPPDPDVTTATEKLNALLHNRLIEVHQLLKLEPVPESKPGQGIVARVSGLPAGGILQQPLPLGLSLDLGAIQRDLKGKIAAILKEIKPSFKFIHYFFERIEYWRGLNRDEATARMLAARDADHAHPLRSEEEGSEVFDYLRRLEQEQPGEG